MTLFTAGTTYDFDLLRVYPQRTYLLASASGEDEEGIVRALASVLNGFLMTYEQYLTPEYLQAKLDRSVKLLLDGHVEYQKAMAAEDAAAMEHWWNELDERRDAMLNDRNFTAHLAWFRTSVLPRRLTLDPLEIVAGESVVDLLDDEVEPTMLNILWVFANSLSDHEVVAVARKKDSRRVGFLQRWRGKH